MEIPEHVNFLNEILIKNFKRNLPFFNNYLESILNKLFGNTNLLAFQEAFQQKLFLERILISFLRENWQKCVN